MEEKTAFYDQVVSRVIRFSEYDGYGRQSKNAAKAIRKKYPHMSLAECEAAFLLVLAVYNEAVSLVASNEADFWQKYKQTGGKALVPEELRLRFTQGHSSLPESVTSGMLSWIFYWHHLR